MSSEVQERPESVGVREGVKSVNRKERANRAWVSHAVLEIQAGRDIERQLGLLFKEYEPLCRSLISSFGLRSDVDDLVQETMWRVYKGVGTFRLDSSFDTWLARIVKNVALNAIRNRETEKARVTTNAASLDVVVGDDLNEPMSSAPDPLDSVLNAERVAELEALLSALPPRMRQSITFYYVDGYKPSEIANLQGTSVHTVKKQIVDGRKRLRPFFSVFAEMFSLYLAVFLALG